jgi:acyl-CoA thioesterase I
VPPSRPPRHDARAGAHQPTTVVAALSVPLFLTGVLVAGGAAAVRLSPAHRGPGAETVGPVAGVLARPTPAATQPATQPATAAASPAATRTGAGVRRQRPVALFVGDSYTAGSGGAGVPRSFACLTARAMGWACRNDGEPGTGYTNPGKVHGSAQDTYPARALRPAAAPGKRRVSPRNVSVVVVTGGRNDSGSPVPVRLAAARLTLDRLGATYPKARIVVVGPFWVDDDVPPSLRRFDDGLRAEAEARSLTFVDPIRERWLTTQHRSRWIAADGVHPSVAGHRRIAAKLVGALEDAGL